VNDEEIKAWMAECTRLVIDHLRRQGFPIDDYRVDLVLTDRAAVELAPDSMSLERAFSESPTTPLVEQALRRIAGYDDETSRQLWTEDADGKPRRDPL